MKVHCRQPRGLAAGLMLSFAALGSFDARAWAAPPKFIVLEETGSEQGGLPVLRRHPDEARAVRLLAQGFSGRIIRLFELEQHYLMRTRGTAPEPAYLLLSNQQGGFPRFGFVFEGQAKPDAGFVDIQKQQDLVGRFGATDQIFPHELMHVILMQLAGKHPGSGANQVHAIGVRTDPETAFNEGLAEHVQVMALDDPDADPSTRALVSDAALVDRADRKFRAYARELTALWAPAGAMRGGFPFWFSQSEQVLRYSAVKANAFAFDPALPNRLLRGEDPYAAYLLESTMPGSPGGPRKTRARALSTEGVVSALYLKWVTSAAIQERYREAEFYRRFGTEPGAVSPLENAYLKLFYAFDRTKPATTAEAIAGYCATFPDEAGDVDAVVQAIAGNGTSPAAPAIWLANPRFPVGTSLFDQWRRIPRVHTFDLNAASMVDLLGMRGMSGDLAAALLAHAPYGSIEAVRAVPGVTPALMAELSAMALEMKKLREKEDDDAEHLKISAILLPYVWHLLTWIGVAGACGALLRRLVAPVWWVRAVLCGLAAAALTMVVGYLFAPSPPIFAAAVPVVMFGVPGGLWRALRVWRRDRAGARRALAHGLRVLAGWAAAALPAVVVMTPLF